MIFLLASLFFMLGIVGILDEQNTYAIYATFGVGLLFCAIGVAGKEL